MARLVAARELGDRLRTWDVATGPAILEIAWERAADAQPVIPGARRVDWQALLWDDRARQLATGEQLVARLAQLGIRADEALVVSGAPVQFGAYAAWALETAGHPDVVLLDGGRDAWIAAGLPLAREEVRRPSVEVTGRGWGTPRTDHPERVDRDEVRAALDSDAVQLVDLRSHEEFLGLRVSPPEFAVDHGAAVAGHLPGATHLPHTELLDRCGRFLPAPALRRRLADAGVDPALPVITYCRLGHRAALGWYALRHVLGAPDVRVYEGSWTEWGSLVGAAVER
ncbi:MAG: sulfurtransferase [Patulibacter minatonensis]